VWSGYGSYEFVPAGVLNATYYGTSLPIYSLRTPPEFRTKNNYCTPGFRADSAAFSGWIQFYVNVYSRNE